MDLPVVQHSMTPASSTGLSEKVCRQQHELSLPFSRTFQCDRYVKCLRQAQYMQNQESVHVGL